MHSRIISIVSRAVSTPRASVLSTEKPGQLASLWPPGGVTGARSAAGHQEHPVLPRTWRHSGMTRFRLAFGAGHAERKESERLPDARGRKPNRKETRNPAFRLLLNRPNTSRIQVFALRLRLQRAAMGEVVMDRGAESAAGGCDVI